MNQIFSFYDIYIRRSQFYCLTFKCDLTFNLSEQIISNEQLCQIILKSMDKCRSYGSEKLN